MSGRTSVTIAHRLTTAENADEVIVFDKRPRRAARARTTGWSPRAASTAGCTRPGWPSRAVPASTASVPAPGYWSDGREFPARPRHRRAAQARRRRPGPGRGAAARHRRGADAGLDGRRGAAPHADHRAGDLLEPVAAGVLGQGRDLGHTGSGSRRSGSTATATRCWSRSTRTVRPATPAPAPASTTAAGRPVAEAAERSRTASRPWCCSGSPQPVWPPSPATSRGRSPGPGRVRARRRRCSRPPTGSRWPAPWRCCCSRPGACVLVTRGWVRRMVDRARRGARRSACWPAACSVPQAGPRAGHEQWCHRRRT